MVSAIAVLVNAEIGDSPDRHRHTSHRKIKKEEDRKAWGKSREVVPEIGRQEAARLILKTLPKLGQEWRREPQKLPGWKDSL